MTAVLEGGDWSAARPGRTLPPGKTRYPFYRRLGGPQGRSGRAENLVPTGIRSRTVQPVAQSLYRLSYPAHNTNTFIYIYIYISFNKNLCVSSPNRSFICNPRLKCYARRCNHLYPIRNKSIKNNIEGCLWTYVK